MKDDRTRALLELLYHVSREVATAIDLRTVLQRVLYEATQNVGGERGSIVVLDDNGKPLDATIVYGKRFHDNTIQQLRDTVERGLAGWVVHNRKAALIPDTSTDQRWLRRPDDSIEQSGAKSAICVPLLARERLVGVLTLVHPVPDAFNQEHLELMQAIADQAGIAVLNARLYTESLRQARVMTALAEGAVTINATLQLEEVLQRILNQTMQALQVETVALALMERPGGDLVFQAAAGQNAGNILGRRVPSGEGVIGIVAGSGRGLVIPAAKQDARITEVDHFAGIEARSIIVAPIPAHGQVIGILEAINPVSGTFEPDALLVLTGIGSLAGTTIHNAQLFEHLQEAHQRYHELFEDSIDPILISDWEGHILEVNRPAVSLSGYHEAELHEKSIDQLHDVDWQKTGRKFEALSTGETCIYESQLHNKDDRTVPIEVYARRMEIEEVVSVQWIMRDITERKQLDSLRNDLTAMIYHDLRSPLANVVSSLEVLSEMTGLKDDDNLKSLLNIAKNSTARIQRLISSLLDINRLESGQTIVTQDVFEPALLVEDAIKAVEPAANGRHQTIKTNLLTNLPPIWVDGDMIRRVLMNLLENAIKFSPAEAIIEVGTEIQGDWVHIWVQDNGPGIPTYDQERIFNKYTRLRSRDATGGLGLGLAFCRLVVQGHGGRIWVESQSEYGSQFHLTLPTAKSAQNRKTSSTLSREDSEVGTAGKI